MRPFRIDKWLQEQINILDVRLSIITGIDSQDFGHGGSFQLML
jgi:hypothetical protein